MYKGQCKRMFSQGVSMKISCVGFQCLLGVRQGECLYPLLFAMYNNNLEEKLELRVYKGIENGMLK